MNKDEFTTYVSNKMREHPHEMKQIKKLWNIALCKMNDSRSESHEIELAVDEIEQLIKEKE